jgi:plastocyanin
VRGGSSLGRRAAPGLSVAIVGVLALGTSAWAGVLPDTETVVAEGQTAFVDPDKAIDEGATLLFQNNDTVTHNVTAQETGPDGKALFRSGNIPGVEAPPGEEVAVNGTQFLDSDAGPYDFLCTIHPAMEGTLTVDDFPAGPVPRPSIDVKVKSKKLAKVVKSGKLKVKVSASEPTDADGVSLTARKGAKGITKRARLNLDAGDSKTAKLKLKKKAAEKLADLEKAKVKVQGAVDFGFGDRASKKLK